MNLNPNQIITPVVAMVAGLICSSNSAEARPMCGGKSMPVVMNKTNGVKEHFCRKRVGSNWVVHGPWLRIYPNGNEESRTYRNGREHGRRMVKDAQGRVLSMVRVSRGRKVGREETWFKNGKLKSRVTYRNGVLDGVEIQKSLTGRTLIRRSWRRGKLHGWASQNNKNGRRLCTAKYKRGRLQRYMQGANTVCKILPTKQQPTKPVVASPRPTPRRHTRKRVASK